MGGDRGAVRGVLTLGFEHDAGAASFVCDLRGGDLRGVQFFGGLAAAVGISRFFGGLGGGEAGEDLDLCAGVGGADELLWVGVQFDGGDESV